MQKINWFIGHMFKSFKKMQEELSNVDLVIQIIDARATEASSNPDLIDLVKNKIVLNIALKTDLANIGSKDDNIKFLSIKKVSSLNKQVITYLHDALSNKIEKQKSKGLKNPHFYVMVIGLPNVGKSSFINVLSKNKKAVVQNRPGVTRNLQLIKINNNFSLYDTPGIVAKNIEDLKTGYILGLIGCIDKKVLPLEDVVKFATDFHFKTYEKQMRAFFKYQKEYEFFSFLNHAANYYNFKTVNSQPDTSRTNNYLFQLYLSNKIVKVNYNHA